MNVLLVDDEPVIVETVSEILTVNHIENTAVMDPLQALEAIKEQHFSLIISDVSMPGMSGPQLFKKVRELGIDTPFIFMTGYEVTAHLKEVAGEASPIVNKPVDISKLLDLIKNMNNGYQN